MDSPLNGIDFNILRIDVQPQTTNPITTVPSSLVTLNKWNEASADITRTITITGETPTTMDGPFYFNHQLFDMMRVDYEVPLNNTEIWTISNQSTMAHPFHIHDVQFYILDRDGISPAPKEAGRKDVVMVNSNETVRFIAKFEDFTDSIIPYMYHCHILMHEDDGMMGQFIVGESGMMGVNELAQKNDALLVYPNPATDGTINIELKNKNLSIQQVEVIDVLGRVVKHIPITDHTTGSIYITAEDLNKGTYFIRCISSEGLFTSHFVKQ